MAFHFVPPNRADALSVIFSEIQKDGFFSGNRFSAIYPIGLFFFAICSPVFSPDALGFFICSVFFLPPAAPFSPKRNGDEN